MYFRHKSQPESPPPSFSASFAFDGEYSVVAPDFNLLSRRDEVSGLIVTTKLQMEQAGGILFE